VIEIEDTGRGIRDEDLPHIFDKFYRGRMVAGTGELNSEETELPGAGLGLNLARALIQGMNGSIEVKSSVGQGSTFTVRLPVWKEKMNENEREPESGISEAGAGTHDLKVAEGTN
jgi:two-component system sensor histidine kinase BaeS